LADIYTTATQLAILQAGRTPVWQIQADAGSSAAPAAADSGAYLDKATRVLLHVSLREQAHRRTVRLTVPVNLLTGDYVVTINAVTVTYNATAAAPADAQAVIDGLAAAIVASGTASAIVTATAVDTGGAATRDTVLLRGVGEASYSVNFTHSGAAVVAAAADADTANMRLWWAMGARSGSVAPVPWAWSGELCALDYRGPVVRLDSAGMDRLFVELSDRAGNASDGGAVTLITPVISIGPALTEIL